MDNEPVKESDAKTAADAFYADGGAAAQPDSDAAGTAAKDRKRRIRLTVRIAVLVIVGTLLTAELLGLRFIERLAVCDEKCACDHRSDLHSRFTEFYPCHGVRLETEDYDFFFSYDNDDSGNPAVAYLVRGVKQFGLMYYEASFESWELLYDDSGEPAFNLIVFKGQNKNYYFINYLTRDGRMVYNGDLKTWREYLHRCERVTVNGEAVDLYLMSFFEYEGDIDTVVMEDGTTVHPKTCRREEPMLGNLPPVTVAAPPQTPAEEPQS